MRVSRFLAAARRCALVAAGVCLLATPAHAEKADRNKAIHLEADRVTVDDGKQIATFIGNVVLTQGSMIMRGDRMEVRQDKEGFRQGVMWGNLAYFRQRREGYDDYIEGFSERLEYDGKADKMQMFTNARIQRGGDEVRGDYISYNAVTEFFQVIGGGKSAATSGNPQGRVHAVIQPKPKPGTPAASPGAVELKPSGSMQTPKQ